MDSDAWRPFDPVDVKRQVGPGRRCGNNRGFRRAVVGRGARRGEDDDSDGDFASGDSEYTWLDYTWLDVSVVTFITLKIDAGA